MGGIVDWRTAARPLLCAVFVAADSARLSVVVGGARGAGVRELPRRGAVAAGRVAAGARARARAGAPTGSLAAKASGAADDD